MKGAFLVVVLLLLAGCSDDKDEPTGTHAQPDPTKGTLSAVVVSNTIQPLSDAVVTLLPGDEQKNTNLFGRVAFSGLEPGSYQVRASLDGFGTDQATVQVVAGQTAKVRLVLQREAVPIPRHVTHEFPGYFSASGGPAHDAASGPLSEAGLYECVCDFSLTAPKGTVAFVIEAIWSDNYEPPVPSEYRWNMTWNNVTLGGKGPSPLRDQADAASFSSNFTAAEQEVEIAFRPDEVWPNTDQSFHLYVTVFEVAMPAEDWSFLTQ